MYKIAIIRSEESANWRSCVSISSNLLSSYRLSLGKKLQLFYFKKNDSNLSLNSLALSVISEKFTHVVFIDHIPHPYPIIRALAQQSGPTSSINIIIHVFGDFILNAREWLAIEDDLKKFKVRFICASEKQQELIGKLLHKSKASSDVCPFSVDNGIYFFDLKLREKIRKINNIQKKEVVFLYSGRLSYQKNIHELLKSYLIFCQNSKIQSRLLLCGPYDEMGVPYLGIQQFPQKYYKLIDEAIIKTNVLIKGTGVVEYLGDLALDRLNEIYNLSDVFVSLSTHNDEDYGMSPAEALCTGLPLILTRWGGYSSFKKVNNQCDLIAVKISINEFIIDCNKVALAMKNSCDYFFNNSKSRNSLSLINQKSFSIEAVSKLLLQQLPKPYSRFKGFSCELVEIQATKNIGQLPFAKKIQSIHFNDLYIKLYNDYAK